MLYNIKLEAACLVFAVESNEKNELKDIETI